MSVLQKILSRLRFNRKNWKAVVLSIFAATIFWFFNALNKNYTANIDFPVEIRFDQESYIPVKNLPEEVRINVAGIGWDLFRKSAGLKVNPLVITLERPAEVKKIVGHTLPALFTTQLDGMQINFVLTDTLFINIDHREKRKFFLTLDTLSEYLDPGYALRGNFQITPDTVWIEGPRKMLQELPDTIHLSLGARSIDTNYDEVLGVKTGSSLLVSSPAEVNASFEVERLIEKKDSLRLQLVNVPARFKRTQSVNYVVCTFLVPESLEESFSPDSLRAELDLSNLKKGSHNMIPQVKDLPSRIRVTAIDSVRLNY